MGEKEQLSEEEREYNRNPNERIKLHPSIRIYEDKKVEEMMNHIIRIEHKCNKLISMLTAHDYACEKRIRGVKK